MEFLEAINDFYWGEIRAHSQRSRMPSTKTNAENKKNKNQKTSEDGILLAFSSIVSQNKEEYDQIHEGERLQILLNQYSNIFYAPLPLPPHWTQDHLLLLLPNTIPVVIRPYWYPPNLKTKIDGQVERCWRV